MDDLAQAAVFAREALALRTLGDGNRATSLSDLAHYLDSGRYKLRGKTNDITEAIAFE